ncbi:DUF5642 family protein [Mycobacterium spongiae]|uniref:DUF5642 domain-containing protein n=1 Tax=Mycobacterium spongiae TaxID=886343 RepID=A0A975JZR0_9MYCO|nr:DUF5642 family protein [Mycobacterium spongiae]QUR68706.1 hypothetical protein F6B93_17940 [Mycobacterium spongiae]
MRPVWIAALAIPIVALLAAACSQQPPPGPAPTAQSPAAHSGVVNPDNIRRVGRELPPGYEVSSVPRADTPSVIWGLGAATAHLQAKPPQCMSLADPAGRSDRAAQGISGSGAGGIVDAVVVVVSPAPVDLDHEAVAACGHWTVTGGRTTAHVGLSEAPAIDGAETLGMVADIRTSVESGTEIESRTYTFVAYLGGAYAFTALTTDPGSMHPPLAPQFAADLLVKTVATLRS